MDSETDWLDGPVEPEGRVAIRKRAERIRRPKALIEAERKLTPVQRLYLWALLESTTVADANRKIRELTGRKILATTFCTWRRRGDFVRALEHAQGYALQCMGINRNKIMLDAEAIKQKALTPVPILHKGEDTGFQEVNYSAALKALEIQGKGVGIGGDDGRRTVVNIDIDFSGRAFDIEGEATVIDGE